MFELLTIIGIFFLISNLYFFLLFRKKNKNLNLFFTIIFGISILISIYVAVKNSTAFIDHFLQSFLFLLLINILIPSYFLMLLGINWLLENIPIIRGYFSYHVIFSVLSFTSTIIYYSICILLMTVLTLDYF